MCSVQAIRLDENVVRPCCLWRYGELHVQIECTWVPLSTSLRLLTHAHARTHAYSAGNNFAFYEVFQWRL